MSDLALYQPAPGRGPQATFELVPAAMELANRLAPTEFVPAGLRNRPAAVLAAILTGAEVGLPPMAALNQIFVIDGKPGMYALGMRALVLSRGHHIRFVEQSVTRVVMVGRRRGEDTETTVTWTIDDAKRSELAGKTMWRKYPRHMLTARATGDLCRAIFADVIAGIPYLVEELEDGFVDDAPRAALVEPGRNGEVVDAQPTRSARRTRRERAQPPVPPEPPSAVEDNVPPEEPASGPDPAFNAEAGALEPPAEPADPGPLAPADETAPGETLTPAQQLAMACEQAGIERGTLIQALTGKTRGRDLTREQAYAVLETAKAIARGERRLFAIDGEWHVLPVESGEEPGDDLFGGRA